MNEKNEKLKILNSDLKTEVQKLNKEANIIDQLRIDKKNLQKKLNYYENKLSGTSSDFPADVKNKLEEEVQQLRHSISSLKDENKDLQQLIVLLEDEEVVTFQNGRYSNELRFTYYADIISPDLIFAVLKWRNF